MIIKVTRIPATKEPQASVIMLHGLGNSSLSWKRLPELIDNPHINYIFPDAQIHPVKAIPYQFKSMWFDIIDVGDSEVEAIHDETMFWTSVEDVEQLINEEIQRGIPSDKIIVGGFSQGGSVALGVAIDFDKPLACIVCFGGFITTRREIGERLKNINCKIDIFHGHGLNDPMIHQTYVRSTSTFLRLLGFENYQLHEYQSFRHGIEPDELKDAIQFIKSHVR